MVYAAGPVVLVTTGGQDKRRLAHDQCLDEEASLRDALKQHEAISWVSKKRVGKVNRRLDESPIRVNLTATYLGVILDIVADRYNPC